MRKILVILLCIAVPTIAVTQTEQTSSKTTLNSSLPLSEAQLSFDVQHYELRNEILPESKSIAGSSIITFKAIIPLSTLELNFDRRYTIESISDAAGSLEYERDDSKVYVALRDMVAADAEHSVTIVYHGQPHEAEYPPWAGGFQWSETESGEPWIATAIQGEGCDLWWPCVDHPQREPKSMDLYLTVDEGLTAASNGVLVNVDEHDDGHRTFHWRTELQTNTYGIALNVGPYVLLEDTYTSSNGTVIPVKFWVLEEHEAQGRELMEREFAATIEFFERKLGPYPWGEEKLGVVETPHLGMEHQTINAYGNKFKPSEYGFDWLFHHELAHEWFGNVMTHETVSDMWLHEGTAAYMQPEYIREIAGDAAYHKSLLSTYKGIKACNAIAPRDEFSTDELYFDDVEGKGPAGDIYAKGAWLLQSLRYVMGEEKFWRSLRVLIYDTAEPAKLKPPIQARLRSTDDYLRIASEVYGQDLDWFFEVYARRGPLPVLNSSDSADGVLLEWQNIDDLDFPMPAPVMIDGALQRIEFVDNRAVLEGSSVDDIQLDPFRNILRKLPSLKTCEEQRAEEAEEAKAE